MNSLKKKIAEGFNVESVKVSNDNDSNNVSHQYLRKL